MSQELIVVEESQPENYQVIINDLLDRLLINYPELEYEEYVERHIVHFYYECLVSRNRIPEFFELLENVNEFNEGLFWEAAAIQFDYEFDLSDYRDDEARMEQIDELAYEF